MTAAHVVLKSQRICLREKDLVKSGKDVDGSE